MDISKVTLDPAYQADEFSKPINAVILDVKIENSSNDTLTWAVAQDKIVTNTKEQVDGFLYSERVDGKFIGKVVKTGKIVFEIQGDLSAITSIKYAVDAPYGGNYRPVGEDKIA